MIVNSIKKLFGSLAKTTINHLSFPRFSCVCVCIYQVPKSAVILCIRRSTISKPFTQTLDCFESINYHICQIWNEENPIHFIHILFHFILFHLIMSFFPSLFFRDDFDDRFLNGTSTKSILTECRCSRLYLSRTDKGYAKK